MRYAACARAAADEAGGDPAGSAGGACGGLPPNWQYLDGHGSASEFRDKGIFTTRQLAKRQLTWLRGELDARWFDPARDLPRLQDAVSLFLGR